MYLSGGDGAAGGVPLPNLKSSLENFKGQHDWGQQD